MALSSRLLVLVYSIHFGYKKWMFFQLLQNCGVITASQATSVRFISVLVLSCSRSLIYIID